jgi:hypothetical protein
LVSYTKKNLATLVLAAKFIEAAEAANVPQFLWANAGLPDGIFSYPNLQFWKDLEWKILIAL